MSNQSYYGGNNPHPHGGQGPPHCGYNTDEQYYPPQQQDSRNDQGFQPDGPTGDRGVLGAIGGGLAGGVGGHAIGGKAGHSKLGSKPFFPSRKSESGY